MATSKILIGLKYVPLLVIPASAIPKARAGAPLPAQGGQQRAVSELNGRARARGGRSRAQRRGEQGSAGPYPRDANGDCPEMCLPVPTPAAGQEPGICGSGCSLLTLVMG